MRLSLVTPPESEPVVPAEVIAHLRLPEDTPEDALLEGLVNAARQYAEAYTARQFMTAVWQITLDGFPWGCAPIFLPLPPLQTVSSVKYLDGAGTLQTWAANQYVVEAPQGPRALEGLLYPALGCAYPATGWRGSAVVIEYKAGYGDQAAVPAGIKQAMLLMIGHLYENRESVVVGNTATEVPLGVDALLGPFSRLSLSVR